jgi:hypothetical protein
MTPERLVPRRPAAKKVETLASPILQLKVRLLDISPMIWRRVLVPASFTLRELHGVIQVAMGWESFHLYYFHIRAVQYGSFDLCVQSPDVALAGFRFRKGARFTYAYDMGDFWRHEIRVEEGLEPSAGRFHPVCIGGAHGCPPEDCGGPAGYAERRLEAAGFDALEDLATLADWVQDVVLDGRAELLADTDRLGDLEDVLDRMKARQPYLADEFSRRAVNARFRKGEHRDLMHQQF